jgi:transcriptional regulator with XRE-family HTH domain
VYPEKNVWFCHGCVRGVERLRRRREQRALRQEDLAELAGIGKNTVNRLEKIHTEPHLTTIRKLATALGVDPRELLED